MAAPITSGAAGVAGLAQPAGGAKPAATRAQPPAESFGAVLQQTLSDARTAGERSEVATIQALGGQISLQEVVEAVNAAEITLQTVVAVRDRLIAAYQDIIRMPI